MAEERLNGGLVSSQNCNEHDRLAAQAHAVLKQLHELTARQLDAFESGDRQRFIDFDKELETTVGEKERRVGALRQHDEEHGCQLGVPGATRELP